jgi:hypothetical protein
MVAFEAFRFMNAAHEQMREEIERLNTVVFIAGKPTGRGVRCRACKPSRPLARGKLAWRHRHCTTARRRRGGPQEAQGPLSMPSPLAVCRFGEGKAASVLGAGTRATPR